MPKDSTILLGAFAVFAVVWAIMFSLFGYFTVDNKNPWVKSNWVGIKYTQSGTMITVAIGTAIVLGIALTVIGGLAQ